MAIPQLFFFESDRDSTGNLVPKNLLGLRCGPEGTPNTIPFGMTCVADFVAVKDASERWVITEPEITSGRNGAILYRSEKTIYGKSCGQFYVLVTCDPSAVNALSTKVLSADEANGLLASLCRSRLKLEDFAGKLSKQREKILSLLWKAKGHKISLDTLATKLWGRKVVGQDQTRREIGRLNVAILGLDSPLNRVSVSTKARYAVLELPDK